MQLTPPAETEEPLMNSLLNVLGQMESHSM